DDGEVVGEFVDAGVVVRFGADEQVRVNDPRNVAQNLRNPLGGELACSAGTRSVVDQAFLPAEKQHEGILPSATARGPGKEPGDDGQGHFFFRRAPTASTIASSSGN